MDLGDRPQLDEGRARELLAECFDIRATVHPLPSERDLNFRADGDDGRRYVLKIAHPAERSAVLEFQNELLQRLARKLPDYAVPTPIADRDGAFLTRVRAGDQAYIARVVTWVAGTTLAHTRPVSSALLGQVGSTIGGIAVALDGFTHTAAHRHLKWKLSDAPAAIRARLERVEELDDRLLLESWLARIENRLDGRRDALRTSVIHNDANDHNIVVAAVDGDHWESRKVAGLIDVGDALHDWTVAELAVAIAYSVLDRADVLGALRAVVAGYHERFPLEDNEIEVLFELVALRLCLSVAVAAEQRAQDPGNDYLAISEAAAWRTLERLADIDPALAVCHARAACGLEPCPDSPGVRRWLDDNRDAFHPVMDIPAQAAVLDLSVGSLTMGSGAPGEFETATLTRRLDAALDRAGCPVGIGRYNETRCWYGGELFAAPADEAPRRRTVHLGIDVFARAGAEVRAPLDGRLISAAINRGRLDYGPTVILEHAPASGVRFRTLYGHLDADSITHLSAGDSVAAGARIGALGAPPDNGDWPAHLHFQIVCDALDFVNDFPGVCAPDERAVWTSLSPDPNLILGLDAAALAAESPEPRDILRVRNQHLGGNLSVAYRRPLTIVRGYRQFLYDIDGQPFLDAVNNVPHVGHCHPRVVEAAQWQNAVLNTNTRYLHENLTRYAERLAARMPAPLEICFFVCSGSEANELALRLARTATGRHDVAVLDGAYHGNTSALIDMSPYKHAGAGGLGAPDWVHVAALPDPYRTARCTRYTGALDDDDALLEYLVGDVERCCRDAERNGGLAAFFAESLPGCGGQVVPPAGYLAAAFARVRAAGGVCVADEVQIGFGRAGSHFWAFETQGVVPDIVTLGKPIGNGFPLAAVVTTRAIAEAFANGMEYFNTFGGNPVSCAVGLAVLDVLEAEDLQANAADVGARLLAGFRDLLERHRIIGDVRGCGLYMGIELVRDHATLEPAASAASYVVNRMREHGILISTDGPLHNVLKLKPPMCFDREDAVRTIATLDAIFAENFVREAAG